MKIIITGIAGFIGYHTAMYFKQHEIIGIDNFNGILYDADLKFERAKRLLKAGIKIINYDLHARNIDEVIDIMRGADVVFHFAALAGVRLSKQIPKFYYENNCFSTINLMEFFKTQRKQPLIIFASSSGIYGDNIGSSEYDSPCPLNIYTSSKVSCENILYSYHKAYNSRVVITRFYNVYGQYGRPDGAIYKFIKGIINGEKIKVFGDGEQTRAFTYINDLLFGFYKIIEAAKKEKSVFEIFNFGNDRGISINRLIKIISEALKKKAKIKYVKANKDEIKYSYANIEHARELLGWEPKVSIEHGIKEIIKNKHKDFKY